MGLDLAIDLNLMAKHISEKPDVLAEFKGKVLQIMKTPETIEELDRVIAVVNTNSSSYPMITFEYMDKQLLKARHFVTGTEDDYI